MNSSKLWLIWCLKFWVVKLRRFKSLVIWSLILSLPLRVSKVVMLLLLSLFWSRYLSSYWFVLFNWLKGYFIDTRAFWTTYVLSHAESETQFNLTAATNYHTIQRVTLIHVFAGTTYVNLSIARNWLDDCADIACDFPDLRLILHHWQTWLRFFLLGNLLSRGIILLIYLSLYSKTAGRYSDWGW